MDSYRHETIAYTIAKLAEVIGDSNREASRLLAKLKRQVLDERPPVDRAPARQAPIKANIT
ncbi:hypothetical protein [Bordetella sp. BOR01]|uniref:hypothetical protein n=1 Tax=Bordetella sp. BOR01 TaxID=2854779 RepID=UPI001C450FCC|nr:hypothetical protein [Bordetella sp. BOR01]MBV7481417.1 hypothetical protein [Bordetella sp. BOR01]